MTWASFIRLTANSRRTLHARVWCYCSCLLAVYYGKISGVQPENTDLIELIWWLITLGEKNLSLPPAHPDSRNTRLTPKPAAEPRFNKSDLPNQEGPADTTAVLRRCSNRLGIFYHLDAVARGVWSVIRTPKQGARRRETGSTVPPQVQNVCCGAAGARALGKVMPKYTMAFNRLRAQEETVLTTVLSTSAISDLFLPSPLPTFPTLTPAFPLIQGALKCGVWLFVLWKK